MKEKSFSILCVDDVQQNLYAYEILLQKLADVTVYKASSGEEALKLLLRHRVDLILLDVQMPEMDGYEVAKVLQGSKSTKDIPIIFITAVFKQDEFIAKGFALGAVDYMTKPLDDNLLLNRIRLYRNLLSEKAKALESMQMFYDIAQSMGIGLYVINAEGRLKFINDTALSMLGYERDELAKGAAHDLIHIHTKDGMIVEQKACPIYRVFDSKEPLKLYEDALLKKDDSILPVTTVASPLMKEGVVDSVVCLFRDTTKDMDYAHILRQKAASKSEMVLMLIDAIDKRDPYTAGHTRRVAEYCKRIAKEMGYAQEQIELLESAAHLHDVGKITTPDSILLKPSHFDKDEYEIMKLHLQTGYELISTIQEYQELAEVMRYHHERYDGKGYPLGLSADAIPPLARIMIVADAFDAMTTNRVYKKRKSVNEALAEIKELSGIQFHPEVVAASIVALHEVDVGEYLDQRPHNILEEKRYAYYYHDRLTGLYNIEYLPIVLDTYFRSKKIKITKINLHKMNDYNVKHGWESGNKLLREFANYMHLHIDEQFIFRYLGDDFIVLSLDKSYTDSAKLNEFLARFGEELFVSAGEYEFNLQEIDHTSVMKSL